MWLVERMLRLLRGPIELKEELRLAHAENDGLALELVRCQAALERASGLAASDAEDWAAMKKRAVAAERKLATVTAERDRLRAFAQQKEGELEELVVDLAKARR